MNSQTKNDIQASRQQESDGCTGENQDASSASPPSHHTSLLDRVQRGILIALIIALFLTFLVLIPSIPILYFRAKHDGEIVQSVTPAGRVISVTLYGGFLTRSLIETDTAFYALTSGFSLGKNEPLTVEIRTNGDRYLCDGTRRCVQLY